MSSVSMPMPLASGFVAFDEPPRVRVSPPAPRPPVFVQRRPDAFMEPMVVDREADVASVGAATPALLQSPSWAPASSRRVRAVEGTVIAALCGWFLYGGLAVLGWV